MTALQKLIATVVVLVLVAAGVYFFGIKKAVAPSETATSTPQSTATTTSNTPALQLNSPDYKKPILFDASISADIRAQLNAELAIVQGQIAKNPINVGAWTNLGAIHKQGGDYAGAVLYWEYITSVYEGPASPFYSLGDLYQNFLHDYTKAETNYKEAIKINPKNVNAYASLYTMYHFTLKNDTKAAAILEQGLKANPGNTYLLSLQAELQGK